jgi:AraC-like DNA-binding protein
MAALGSTGTFPAALFLAMTDMLEQLGFATDPILAACGIDRRLLHRPFARVPANLEHRLWAEIERATGDPTIGLTVGARYARKGRFTVDLYLALHSATLRSALRNVERFVRIADDRGHFELREHGALATVQVYRDGGLLRPDGFLDALFASIVTLFSDRVTGFCLHDIHVQRTRPASVKPYVDMYGVVPSFGATWVGMSFRRDFLDVPLRGTDLVLGEILLLQVQQLWEQTPAFEPLVVSIQQALTEGFARGQATLPAVARHLGTSSRTLRRRLTELGTSFQTVVDGVRSDLATQQLRHGEHSIAQIGERLGFASTSAFQRAFQRWHGVAPSSFRAETKVQRATR